jgi:oxygen-independent coproporphyrinogen-3 oxidase
VTPTVDQWVDSLKNSLQPAEASWSMYVHVPFCETLCTFCGCNNIITKNHQEEMPYISYLKKELDLYFKNLPLLQKKPLKMIHFGGGTPTFLSAEHLQEIVKYILDNVVIDKEHFEGSIEVDPRRTSEIQLKVLRDLGFNRVSLGVQDINEQVQTLINRVQPVAKTKQITDWARSMGYESINFDLIYGLPMQSTERMKATIEQTIELGPDRIAFYSFALVPWIKPAQRLFKDEDLPVGAEKRELYEVGRELFLKAGYVEIGMDHFAKPSDALAKAQAQKKLHRNFMGYTDQYTDVLLGIGVSSISESKTIFHQNEKVYAKYKESLDKGILATHRGHILNSQDQLRRKQILEFITTYQTTVASEEVPNIKDRLSDMIQDGLVSVQGNQLKLQENGRAFLRNACSALDEYYQSKKTEKPTYSKSI